jgi:hypothetical protein
MVKESPIVLMYNIMYSLLCVKITVKLFSDFLPLHPIYDDEQNIIIRILRFFVWSKNDRQRPRFHSFGLLSYVRLMLLAHSSKTPKAQIFLANIK